MLNQVNAFKVSSYIVDKSTGFNALLNEIVEDNCRNAILTKQQLLNNLSIDQKQHINIVIDEIILIK